MIPENEFELHVWGPLGSLPSFSPECLACIWYLGLAIPNQESVHIYQSSNTQISHSGVLPALRHAGKVYSGYTSILRYLKSIGYDMDASVLTSSELNTKLPAALAYLDTNLAAISQYLVYVQRKNYEKVTRPLLSRMIRFPMQYAVPLQERAIAEAQCASVGLERQDESKGAGEEAALQHGALSRLHAEMEAQKREKEVSLHEAKESMRMMVFAHEVFENVLELGSVENQKTVGSGGEKRVWKLFSNMSSADLLFLAHLVVETSEEFPYRPIKTMVEMEYPQIGEYVVKNFEVLKGLKVNIEQTRKGDAPSVLNTVYGWVYSWFV